MDFSSTAAIMAYIGGVIALDIVLMVWLRAKVQSRPDGRGVTFLGRYSPILTGLKRCVEWFRRYACRGAGWRSHAADFIRLSMSVCKRLTSSGWRERAAGFFGPAAAARKRLAAPVKLQGRFLRPALMAAALGCGLAGQVQLFRDHNLPGGLPWLAISAAFWLFGFLFQKQDDEILAPHGTDPAPPSFLFGSRDVRALAVMLALQMTALAVALYWNRSEDSSHADIFGLWIAGMGLYLLAFQPSYRHPDWLKAIKTNWKKLLPFFLFFVLAAGLRFYRLGELPGIMENDESTVGVRTAEVIDGLRRNMFDVYGGYGTLYFFLHSLPVAALGRNALALRLVTALAGTLTIPLAGWMGWRLFGYKIGLAAAALLAASHLHVHFSRVSPTAGSFDPLFSSALALLLYEALTRRRPHWWAAAGAVMGAALHFYVGARVMPVIVLAALAALLIFRRDLLRGQAGGLVTMAGGFLVSGGPILSWAVRNPDGFNQRVNQVGIIQSGWLVSEMALSGKLVGQVLAEQLGNALLIFNYHPVGWFYQATVPALGLLGGLLLLFGSIYFLLRLNRLPFLIASAWFWVTLFTGQVLMVDPGPNAYRTLGLLPAACLMMAAAGDVIAVEFGRLFRRWGRQTAAILLAAFIVAEGGWNIHYYFGVWNQAGSYGDENTRRASLIGSYLGSQPPGSEIIIAKSPQFGPERWQALEFLRDGRDYAVVEAPLDASVTGLSPRVGAVVIVPASMQAELDRLKARYPEGEVMPHVFEGKLYFWSMVLNGQ